MPELSELNTGSVLGVRVFKRLGERYWVNNYEVQYLGQNQPSDIQQYLLSLAGEFVGAELLIHHPLVYIDRVVISTIEPDSQPYNPLTFAVLPYNMQCNGHDPNQTLMPLSFCVLVKKKTIYGRSGNILYRGALVTASGFMGPNGFSIGPGDENRIGSALNQLVNGLNNINTSLVLVKLDSSGAIENVRQVISLSVRTIATVKKLYNRYYDIGSGDSNG